MLKSSGFKVVATALSQASIPISDVDWTQPTAVIFGNEQDGEQPYKSGLFTSAAAHLNCVLEFNQDISTIILRLHDIYGGTHPLASPDGGIEHVLYTTGVVNRSSENESFLP